MGNLSCFPASPSKNVSRNNSTISKKGEVGVMDALAESRMTEEEINYFNQVAKEVEANRQRMKGRARATRMSSSNDAQSLASSRTLTSFRRSNNSSDHVRGELTDNISNHSGKKHPFNGATLRIASGSSPPISPPVLTPDSGLSMRANSEKDWEVNVKLVSNSLQTIAQILTSDS